MCTGQPRFSLPFGFYFSLGCFHRFFASQLLCFLDKAGVFVGSSIVVPPVFPFFSPCLPCQFVYFLFFWCVCVFVFLFSFSPLLFSFFFFCIYYEFILAEDLCVHLPLVDFPFFFWRVSCEGGFFFFPFLIFALGAKVSECIFESFGRSGYIPCRISKDGGFIRRDRSFHLPRINPHSEHRFPAPSSKEGCRKPVLGVWVQPSESRAMRDRYP